jgi:hypothetical protein
VFEKDGNNLKDKLEGYISIVTGIAEMIQRYNLYIQQYMMVTKVLATAKSNRLDQITINSLSNELRIAEKFKVKFEETIITEIVVYKEKYASIIEDIKNKFTEYLKVENRVEYISLKSLNYNKYE